MLPVVELVLFEIQFIHDERPVIPIPERKLVAEAHSNSMLLFHKFRSHLTEQVIYVTFKKRSSQFLRISIFEQNFRTGFPVRRSLMKTLHPVSQTLVALEMNLTSSSLF